MLGLTREPTRLVFGLVAGIPLDAEPAAGAPIDYDEILAHPRMHEEIDPMVSTRLRPSCDVGGRGVAMPPVRMVRVAQQLEARGAHVALGSICQASLAGFTTSLVDALAEPLGALETACE